MSLLTITSALPAAASAKYLSSFWIVALPHGFTRLDPLGRNDDNVENLLAPVNGDEAVELRPEDRLAVLVLDLLREDKPVGQIDGVRQGSLREAVYFEGGGDERSRRR